MNSCVLGFNGERHDPISGITHSGNGYRAYNPALMCFHCPDNFSPFGAGGINPYAYCADDPVTRADPSGHFSPGQGIGMALGFVAGIALSIVTEGMAIPMVLSLMATVAGNIAIGAGTELVTEAVDGERVNWGHVVMAAGLSAVASLAGVGAAKGGRYLAGKLVARPITEIIELSTITTARSASLHLEQLLDASYNAERQIMNYLDTASVHNLRQASKAFGAVADRAMKVRMNTMETGIPEPMVRFEDFARRWSRLPAVTLENQLATSPNRDMEIANPEFITWAKKNMLGLGRSYPVGLKDGPVPGMLLHFQYNETGLSNDAIQRYDFPAEAFHSDHRARFMGMLSRSNADTSAWERLSRGFWVGF